MKTKEGCATTDGESSLPVTGDVIGNTAYSERFVLKLLLKFANLSTLKEELKEKSFEDDFCTLWDMTAERDVVLFLLKHEIFNLFSFALTVLEPNRIVEITIGIMGNMCCQKEGADAFLQCEKMLCFVFHYIRTDDSLILIQLLRLVSSCLYLADDEDLDIWMTIFDNVGYSNALYFIMMNSSNKDLLTTALENFNTLCSYCNVEKFRLSFFSQFVTMQALDSVAAAFNELTSNESSKRDASETNEETERIHVITLQLAMNLVGFDKSPEIYNDNRENVVGMINQIITYYEDKFLEQKYIDVDIFDIIESTNTVLNILEVSDIAAPEEFFLPSYNIWRVINAVLAEEPTDTNDFDDCAREAKSRENSEKSLTPLSLLLSIYMSQCSDDNLVKVLDVIDKDYDDILKIAGDKDLQKIIEDRSANYQTRFKENVNS